jgi:type I site-specific restriction-modification system R (restriction) subunit
MVVTIILLSSLSILRFKPAVLCEAQKNLKKKFKKYYQFGFTGTPIFPQNALGAETTGSVFGRELHSYVITDAIRDEKVLKFKVDCLGSIHAAHGK